MTNKYDDLINDIYAKKLSEQRELVGKTLFTEEETKKSDAPKKDNSKKDQVNRVANRVSALRKDIEDLKIKRRDAKNESYKELVDRTIENKREQIKGLERQIGKDD